jgi:SAM-dependent methyltransferase
VSKVGFAFPPTRAILEARRRRIAHANIMERERLLDFWQQREPDGNVPEDYLRPIWRSELLAELLSDVPKDARILEIGCNVGRNLAYLADEGYARLEGIEISAHAVELLRAAYPQLADSEIHLGPVEEVLPRLTQSFDVVFTMAVLEHIHPDSSEVFDHIARLGDTVLTIEPPPEASPTSSRQFPHDLQAELEARGMKLASLIPLADHPLVAEDDLAHYAAYRFERG